MKLPHAVDLTLISVWISSANSLLCALSLTALKRANVINQLNSVNAF